MAKVIDQDIPSEYEKLYGEIARPGYEMVPGSGKFYSQRRYPFKLPYHARIGTIDGTPTQHEVRQIFKECANCFNMQPHSGGAIPPATGPRNRAWWYSQAAGSGLWYYDYFMQQTLNSRFSDIIPNWCQTPDIADCQVFALWPDTNSGSSKQIGVYCGTTNITHLYMKFDTSHLPQVFSGFINIYIEFCTISPPGFYITMDFTIYKVIADWNENTITWNNQPTLGEIIGNITYELGPRDPHVNQWAVNAFWKFPARDIKKCPYGICIKGGECEDKNGPLGHSRQYPTPGLRPYFSA